MKTVKNMTPPVPRLKLVAVMDPRPSTISEFSLVKSPSQLLTVATSSRFGSEVTKSCRSLRWSRLIPPPEGTRSRAMKLTVVITDGAEEEESSAAEESDDRFEEDE
jgi:hypothetical protein